MSKAAKAATKAAQWRDGRFKAALKFAAEFDALPDDALFPPMVGEILSSGQYKEQEWRRRPPIPKRPISEKRGGFRVGDWRKLVRGEIKPITYSA